MKATVLKEMQVVSSRWCLALVAWAGFAASAAGASLTITSPGNSKPVALLSAANKAFYELSLEQRQENLLTNKGQQPESNAKPVKLAWTGGTAPFAVTVKSGLTGKILYPYNAKSTEASSLDLYNLELGATYTCTVADPEPLGGGSWRVSVALDERLAPAFATGESGQAIAVAATGVALAIANAEPGLWYGVAAAADLESLKTAAAGSWKQCVAQGTLTWEKLEPPSREGGFYRVVVSEGGSL